MYQPETEDMLPRMAPKPSCDVPTGVNDGIVRPEVPEVSILFSKQDVNSQHLLNSVTHQQTNNVQPQSYASWRKQMLPKVSYPATKNVVNPHINDPNMVHNNNYVQESLYPMRKNTNPSLNVNVNGGAEILDQITYRRNLESYNNNFIQQIPNLPNLNSQPTLGISSPILNHLPLTNSNKALTICAGTQTDTELESTSKYVQSFQSEILSNMASKKDIENVRYILDELKAEQQRILKIMETIFLSHYSQITAKPMLCDVGVQVDCKNISNPQYANADMSLFGEQALAKNKFLQHVQPNMNILQTPNGKPIAQSTTYRQNPPHLGDFAMSTNTASDVSLVMNELALKYLPNEKLAELLKELNIDCPLNSVTNVPTTTGSINKSKHEKGPSDISNASYKYLKKYRLLSEEHEENGNHNNANERIMEGSNDNQIPQYNSPQFIAIRNTPINQKSPQTNRCSPHSGRLPLSPLARIPSTPAPLPVTEHIVNLENIKHQPKFL